jgi:hypothetical protein
MYCTIQAEGDNISKKANKRKKIGEKEGEKKSRFFYTHPFKTTAMSRYLMQQFTELVQRQFPCNFK